MRLSRVTFLLMLFIAASASSANAQCKTFAKKSCLPELGEYTHDGNYHAIALTEGEEAELYKTFYSGMDYRMAVCSEEGLPHAEFTVVDSNRNILFSSKDAGYPRTWDFKLESSQQLRIVIKVISPDGQGITPANGCVSIMFGFKIK